MFERDVYIGNDGWLFLAGGSNDTRKLFTDPQYVLTFRDAWLELFKNRIEKIKNFQIQYRHVWVPEKISVYSECINDDFPIFSENPLSEINEAIHAMDGDLLIDLHGDFFKHKLSRQLYWKTDTHWTFYGAYFAYSAICKSLGVQENVNLLNSPLHSQELLLDLGSKLNPQIKEVWSAAQIIKNSKITYRNSMLKFLGVLQPRFHGLMHTGVVIRYENTSAIDSRKVLLFGDSFSEYRPHLLTALLAETFGAVTFVWSSSIDYKLIEEVKPDILISQTAERFITRIPDDSLDIDKHCKVRIENFLKQECDYDRIGK